MLDTTKRDIMRHKETRGDMATNGTAMSNDPYVAEYPGVCGGYPVIRETRIPVRVVVQISRAGASFDELAAMWPTVTVAQIRGVLDYYARHPRRVDEDIERHAKANLSAHSIP
jgi:uncharacterized protein (DUF433 family)